MQVQWQVKQFTELTTVELYQLLKLRADVFVVEQNCIYPDIDDKDQKAFHLLGILDNQVVAYARIFAPNDYFEATSSFGRVVTAPIMRGKGFGRQLVSECIKVCHDKWPDDKIEISGQEYLNKFYCSFGFAPEGDIYLEDDIDHRRFIL